MKRGILLLIFALFFLFINLQSVSAVISCGNQTYPDGTGYCCDPLNGDNGVWFRGDYYDSCPSGTFRYVSNDTSICNDAGQGTFSQPWCTAVRSSSANGGDNIIFLGGTYNEGPAFNLCEAGQGAVLSPQNSGTPGNPTIFKGHPDYNRPIIMAHDYGTATGLLAYDGKYWGRAACLATKRWITIDYIEFTEAYCGGIYMGYTNNIIIQDNVIHDTIGSGPENCAGIRVLYGASRDLIIRGNEIYNGTLNVDGSGVCNAENCGAITVYRTTNITVEDNYIHDIVSGIFIKNMIMNSTIRRNKLYNIRSYGAISVDCPGWHPDPSWGDAANNRYTGDIDINENVIIGKQSGYGILFNNNYGGGGCTVGMRNIRTFNNVIYYGYGSGIYLVSYTGPDENFSIFNNLIIINSQPSSNAENLAVQFPQNNPNLTSGNNLYFDDFESDVIYWAGTRYDLNTFRTLIRPDLEINSLQLQPQFLSTTPSSPDFLRPALGSPAIDNGTIIQGYHCDYADDDPVNPMDPNADCKHWFGLAPDIGAYEYNPLGGITCEATGIGNCYYVDKDSLGGPCNNAGPGSFSEPFCDIQTGVNALANPGDVLYIRSGTYLENVMRNNFGGTPANPMVIKGYPGEKAIIDAGYQFAALELVNVNDLIIDSMTFANGTDSIISWQTCTLCLLGGNDVILRNLEVYGTQGECQGMSSQIYVEYGINVLIENNRVHDSQFALSGASGNCGGIGLDSADYITASRNITIRNNIVYNMPVGTGIWHKHPGEGLINTYNNTIYNTRYGAVIRNRNTHFHHNLLYNIAKEGIVSAGGSGDNSIPNNENSVIEYNTVAVCGEAAIYYEYGKNLTIRNNTYYECGSKAFSGDVQRTLTVCRYSFRCSSYPSYANINEIHSDNNCIYYTPTSLTYLRYDPTQDNDSVIKSYYTLVEAQQQFGLDLNSVFADPQFISTDSSNPDFLRPTNPQCMNMGYYAPETQPITCNQVDVNNDLTINIIDLALVIYNQGRTGNDYQHLDINSDSSINYQDVQEVIGRMGQSC